jgi:hypothetical protein
MYDSELGKNRLLGLSDQTINFKTMLTVPSYASQFAFADITTGPGSTCKALDMIEDYRTLRNVIHLPGDYPSTVRCHWEGDARIHSLVGFINRELVDWNNTLAQTHGFPPTFFLSIL